MERSRLRKLATRTAVCALLSGALITGSGTSSQAGHAECGLDPQPERTSRVDVGEYGARAEYGESEGRPYVGVFTGQGTFVVADGDLSGVEVYGRLGSIEILGSKHWFSVKVNRSPGEGEQYLDVCSKPHG